MTELFFTADWHLFHNNIIKYCNRPVKDIKKMHQYIIAKHNELVKPEDTLWYLGDISLISSEYVGKIRKCVNRFNGTKHLVLGNHDIWKATSYEKAGFSTVHTVMWFEHDGIKFYLAHDPAIYTTIENEPNSVLLCGHIHQLFQHLLPNKRVINVGIDAWDFKPVSYVTILNLLKKYNIG